MIGNDLSDYFGDLSDEEMARLKRVARDFAKETMPDGGFREQRRCWLMAMVAHCEGIVQKHGRMPVNVDGRKQDAAA